MSKKLNGSKIKQLCFHLKLPQFWKFSSIFDERFFWWKRKMANTWDINQRKKLRHYISPKLLRIKSCSKILSIEERGVSDVLNMKCCIILKESEILRMYMLICSILSDGQKRLNFDMLVEDTSHWSKTTQNQCHSVSTNHSLNWRWA